MGSFVREMHKTQKEQERKLKVEQSNKTFTAGILRFANSLQTMFDLDEVKHTVETSKTGDFTIYHTKEDDQFLSSFQYMFKEIPKAVLSLRRYKSSRKNGNLLIGYDVSERMIEFIKGKYAMVYERMNDLRFIRFTAIEKSLNNGDFQEVVGMLMEDFMEQGAVVLGDISKTTARGYSFPKIKFADVGFSHMHSYSHGGYSVYDTINAMSQLAMSSPPPVIKSNSAHHQLGLARQMGKDNYLLKQLEQQIKDYEVSAITSNWSDTMEKLNVKSPITSYLDALPDIDLDFENSFNKEALLLSRYGASVLDTKPQALISSMTTV